MIDQMKRFQSVITTVASIVHDLPIPRGSLLRHTSNCDTTILALLYLLQERLSMPFLMVSFYSVAAFDNTF